MGRRLDRCVRLRIVKEARRFERSGLFESACYCYGEAGLYHGSRASLQKLRGLWQRQGPFSFGARLKEAEDDQGEWEDVQETIGAIQSFVGHGT